MSRRRKKRESVPPACRQRDTLRASPRIAFQISVGVHALFVLMMFRMVSEYAIETPVPLQIVARSTAPREAATPSFHAVPLTDVAAEDAPIGPTARVEALPHQSTAVEDRAIVPLRTTVLVTRRQTAPAVLSVAGVIVPDDVNASADVTPVVDALQSTAANQSLVTLERTNTTRDLPLRLASRPIYGPRPQRPLGIASLPQTRGPQPQSQPANAFAHRRAGLRMPPENRTAIDRGLEFLARVQLDDGRWQFRNLRDRVDPHAELPSPRADTAATGLALLAFLGAGHDHFDGRYRRVVEDGLEFLIRSQQLRGEFFLDDGHSTGDVTRFYSHGIATLALSEAFGMTGDPRLRAPAQRALDYLAGAHRNVPGAWRFLPGLDADAVTISWQLATLRSGQLAGLNVDPRTIDAVRAHLAKRRAEEFQNDTAVTTAVGLAMELHLGGSAADERLRPAADTLLAHPPEFGDAPAMADTGPPDELRRDTYYWYYGSEAMYYLGGADWHTWSRQLYPRLIESQIATGPLTGSWDPQRTTTQPTSATGGRLYVTAMNLLSLEIQNRQPPENSATALRRESQTPAKSQ